MSKYEKRNSPSYSAQKYPNKIKIGNDGYQYVSKPDKNMIYKWYKIKSMDKCTSPEKFYMQFPENYLQKKFNKYSTTKVEKILNKLKKELESKNIYLIKIGWKDVYDYVDTSYDKAYNYILKKNNLIDLDKANFIFYTEKNLFWSKNTGKLFLQWKLYKDIKKYTFDLFHKYFKNNFIEPTNISKAMIIKLKK